MCKQDRLLDIERDIYYQNKIALRLAIRVRVVRDKFINPRSAWD